MPGIGLEELATLQPEEPMLTSSSVLSRGMSNCDLEARGAWSLK